MASSQPSLPKGQLSNLQIRVLTALILLPVFFFSEFAGGWFFTGVAMLLTIVGLIEFYSMTEKRDIEGNALVGVPLGLVIVIAFHFHNEALWQIALGIGILLMLIVEVLQHISQPSRVFIQVLITLAGIAYVAFPAGFLVAIRAMPENGLLWSVIIYVATASTDIFAYFGGRAMGRRPLAPKISPKKTIEGAISGVIGSLLLSTLILYQAEFLTFNTFILFALIPFVAIAGDLFESKLKRAYEIKDSGIAGLNIFPGHGGVLDRLDSLLWVAILSYGYFLLLNPVGVAI